MRNAVLYYHTVLLSFESEDSVLYDTGPDLIDLIRAIRRD
jgi:hypothetical protein